MDKRRRITSAATQYHDRRTSSRRDTATYFEHNWIPIQRTALDAIIQRLDNGEFDTDRSKLIEAIFREPGITSRVLNQLPQFLAENELHIYPVNLLSTMKRDTLKVILSKIRSSLSPMIIDPKCSHQISSVRRMLVSLSASEVLAARIQKPSHEAFLTVFTRRFGDLLAAWNYPRIYQRLCQNVSQKNIKFEEEMVKLLGFSPYKIGAELILGWNLSSPIGAAFDSLSTSYDPPDGPPWTVKIAYLSETIGRLADPEVFPSDKEGWDKIISQLESYGGISVLEEINDSTKRRAQDFAKIGEVIANLKIDPETCISAALNRVASTRIKRTTHVIKLEDHFLPSFNQVYSMIQPNTASPLAINQLISVVVPGFGFSGGCIFIDDEKQGVLNPSIKWGSIDWLIFKPVNYTGISNGTNPVVQALYSVIPLVQMRSERDGKEVAIMTGSFGSGSRKGVLYLEIPREQLPKEQLLMFRAISECLSDCLNL